MRLFSTTTAAVLYGLLAASGSHAFTSTAIPQQQQTSHASSTAALHAAKFTSNDPSIQALTDKLDGKTAEILLKQQSNSIPVKEDDIPSSIAMPSLDGLQAQLETLLQNIKTSSSSSDMLPSGLQNTLKEATASLESMLKTLPSSLDGILKQLSSSSAAAAPGTFPDTLTTPSQLQEIAMKVNDVLQQVLQQLNLNTPETIAISSLASFWLLSNILNWSESPPPSKPYPQDSYDPISAQIYFDNRPMEVLSRSLFIVVKSLGFALDLLTDKLQSDKKWEQNMEQRGLQLAKLLTQLGPTFIKIGQSLSIRTDILPPAYVKGLQSLQDQVPAFSNDVAYEILCDSWGVTSIYEVVQSISPQPVAAASLGQVYKAVLKKDGIEVAIKVQRPNIATQIALDMYLLREAAGPARRLFNLNTDTVGTVDAWGTGFVDELNYLQEAENAQYFMEQIEVTPLKDVVFAPSIVEEYTSPKVLVTEWIDGERLDKSSKDDVTILCSICMNTYLTMLLESGLLHCDPHPGNLLRTPEGKLCILDWGMVTIIPPGLQLTLIEHMAHLTSRDYAEVPRDLFLLGFVPKEQEKNIEDSGVVEVLADLYGKWTDGGGIKSVNANDVLVQMQDLAAEKGNLFQIPSYFAYIAKSFSVLEGIGLSNDPQYSIINECLPYISNRLLTDKDSMGNALNGFVFGAEKKNKMTRLVQTKRIEQLVTGFGEFSASSSSGALLKQNGNAQNLTTAERLDKAADQVLDVILAEEDSPVQEILIEQLVKIVTANARYLWTEARLQSGVLPNGRSLLGTIVDPFGIFSQSPLVNVDEMDERTVKVTQELIEIFDNYRDGQKSHPPTASALNLQSLDRQELIEISSILTRKLFERRSQLLQSSNKLLRTLLDLTAARLEQSDRIKRTAIASTLPRASSHQEFDDASKQEPKVELETAGGLSADVASDRLRSARERLDNLR